MLIKSPSSVPAAFSSFKSFKNQFVPLPKPRPPACLLLFLFFAAFFAAFAAFFAAFAARLAAALSSSGGFCALLLSVLVVSLLTIQKMLRFS